MEGIHIMDDLAPMNAIDVVDPVTLPVNAIASPPPTDAPPVPLDAVPADPPPDPLLDAVTLLVDPEVAPPPAHQSPVLHLPLITNQYLQVLPINEQHYN